VGKDGFLHFMAFDGSRPVAMAALVVFEDLGVQRADQIGCSTLVSETLYMLEHS
jgi:hypothetical protein